VDWAAPGAGGWCYLTCGGSGPWLDLALSAVLRAARVMAPTTEALHDFIGRALWSPAAIGQGWAAVGRLQADMDEGRRRRLAYIGFPDDEAAEISALHTRNFM